MEFKYYDFQDISLDVSYIPLDLNPDIDNLVSPKSIIEWREHWTFDFSIVAYREKHKQPIQHLAKHGLKCLVKALVDGHLDNVPAMLVPFAQWNWTLKWYHSLFPKEKELKRKGK